MELEKTLKSPWDCKEIKPVNPKGNQPWIFIGRTNAEAEAPILWSPDVKSQLIGKDPDAGKDWRQEEKGTAENEMVSITNSMNMNLSKCQEIVKDRGAWLAAVHGVAKSRIWLRNWTTMTNPITMGTQDFFNKGCQLQTQFFSTELRGEISASSTNPPHLLLNREYHVKHHPLCTLNLG